MNRREFIGVIGGATLASPTVARTQPRMPTIGFLSSRSPTGFAFYVTAFRNGLRQAGYFEGWNVTVEYRWAANRIDRLPALAADLIGRKVGAIFADAQAALATKAVTTTVPITFSCAGDPLKLGLVRSLDPTAGNVTGVAFPVSAPPMKRLQMLHALAPKAAVIGYLCDPDNPLAEHESNEVEAATRAFGLTFQPVHARGAGELDRAFAALIQARADAIVVSGDEQFIELRDQIIAAAAERKIPALYNLRPWAISGGLMSYGPNTEDANRQCGVYVAHLLRGASVASLPVILSNKIELVVNLKTAKALGLAVPPPLTLAADEVIE
jgi:putative tryptophan/tyrosine transport system substrate-binding protein